ncbi:MAG: imidazole glycerol phosphate synthase subunit HisF [Gemmatimonadota bacterium]|nr:imidazole glycerol phosphate synthase subunit HisF [Gemmatimonadota bacterium]
MLARRIVPCLDVADGRVVKGIRFVDLVDAGDPAEQAARYAREGADEIVLLDIAATPSSRPTALETVRTVASEVFVPLTVGGGVRAVDDVTVLLRAGADKVTINSAAVRRPELIEEASREVGAQAVVIAIDAARTERGEWRVVIDGGRTATDRHPVEWAVEATGRGAGEVLLTSLEADGTQAGYEIELLGEVAEATTVPLVASGGAGGPADILEALTEGRADAALAASIFHFGRCPIGELKTYLADRGVPVRPAVESERRIR